MAVEAVVARCVSEAGLRPASVARLEPTLSSFAHFVVSRGVSSLDLVTVEVAQGFIGSRLKSGRRPSLATQHNRRTALRTLYAAARRLGLAEGDPTLDMVLPSSGSIRTRPLTDDEVERCRDVAQWSSPQVAAAWALAEATARGVEVALVEARDVDLDQATVRLAGGARTEPREAQLTTWGVAALGRRLNAVADASTVAFSGYSAAAGRASTCRAISAVLVRSGVGGRPGVRPASVAGWAGRGVFERTGSIEAAARAMGVRSLDRAAQLIGLDWSGDA